MSNNQEKLNEQLLNVVLSDKDSEEAKLKKVKYLVRLGASVNQKVNGKNLLRIAREKGYKEIENVIKESLVKSFEKLLEGDKFDRVLDECGYANEHKVVVSKEKAINLGKKFWGYDGKLKSAKEIEVLIQQGADVDVQVNNGWTALICASSEGYNEIVQLLLEGGADVKHKDDDGWTALIRASYFGHKEAVEMLLQNGADVNQKNNNGQTALILASREGHKEAVEVLLENGADVNIQNKDGDTALILASREGHKEVVEVLLENGADVNIQNKSGDTALIEAAFNEEMDVVKVLLAHGADVNAQENDGWTALMWAAYKESKDIVQLLLEKGADANIRNNQGSRVWDRDRCDREIVKVIKEHIKKTSGESDNDGGFLGKICGGLTR